jgi:Lon protease-like protein
MEMGSGQFGMCAYDSNQPYEFARFGTMLQIKDIELLSDGRSVVEAVSGKRFRVISCGVFDGYCKASVEWIVDEPIASLSIQEQSAVVELHNRVRSDACAWIESQSKSILGRHIANVYGSIPDVESDWMTFADGPNWLWWLTAVLPFDSDDQVIWLPVHYL